MNTSALASKTSSGGALSGGIRELLGTGGIEVEARGVNIACVRVRLRRLVPAEITVHIPVGTSFVSKDQAVQDMIGTQFGRVTLENDRWKSVRIRAACASLVKNVPTPADRFEVFEAARQVDLERLAPLLPGARSSFAVQQAAVWIATDDASFQELGHLRSRTAASRLVTREDAVRAMQMCAEGGIDVRKKKIWSDRHALVHGLDEPELKDWLRRIDPAVGQGVGFSCLDGLRARLRRLWFWLKQR